MNTSLLGTRTLKRESAALSTLRRDPRVREWMSIFHRATGLAIRLVAPDLEIDSAKICGHENRFCSDAGVKGSRICCRTREMLQRKLRSRLVPQRVVCGTGLTEAAIPVAMGGRHYATFLVGQVFSKKPDARSWARLTAHVGGDGDKQRLARLRQAYLSGNVVSNDILTPLVHTVSLHVCRIVNDLWREEAAQRSRRKRRQRTAGRPK
jgi:ligand-binding sensor protein